MPYAPRLVPLWGILLIALRGIDGLGLIGRFGEDFFRRGLWVGRSNRCRNLEQVDTLDFVHSLQIDDVVGQDRNDCRYWKSKESAPDAGDLCPDQYGQDGDDWMNPRRLLHQSWHHQIHD